MEEKNSQSKSNNRNSIFINDSTTTLASDNIDHECNTNSNNMINNNKNKSNQSSNTDNSNMTVLTVIKFSKLKKLNIDNIHLKIRDTCAPLQ